MAERTLKVYSRTFHGGCYQHLYSNYLKLQQSIFRFQVNLFGATIKINQIRAISDDRRISYTSSGWPFYFCNLSAVTGHELVFYLWLLVCVSLSSSTGHSCLHFALPLRCRVWAERLAESSIIWQQRGIWPPPSPPQCYLLCATF